MAKKEKIERSKHLMTPEDHAKAFKGICEKVNIDHKKAMDAIKLRESIGEKMHDKIDVAVEHDK